MTAPDEPLNDQAYDAVIVAVDDETTGWQEIPVYELLPEPDEDDEP